MKIYKQKERLIDIAFEYELEGIVDIKNFITDIKVKIAHILYTKYKGEYYVPDYNNPNVYKFGSYENVMVSINESIYKHKHTEEDNIIEDALKEYYGEETNLFVIDDLYILVFNDEMQRIELEDYKDNFLEFIKNQIDVDNIKKDIIELSDEELAEKYIYPLGDNLFNY